MNKIILDTQCPEDELEVTTCNNLVVISTGDRYERVSIEMSVGQVCDLINALSAAYVKRGRRTRAVALKIIEYVYCVQDMFMRL